MSPACVVMVLLTPLDGKSDAVAGIMAREIAEIRQADGCLIYDMFRRVDGAVVLVEHWSSRETWQAHFDTPAIKRLRRDLTPLLAKPAERWEMYPPES